MSVLAELPEQVGDGPVMERLGELVVEVSEE
jgi:hypothetical protein